MCFSVHFFCFFKKIVIKLISIQGEALRCYCGGKRRCSSPIETCITSDSVCISANFYGVPRKSCMRRSLITTKEITASDYNSWYFQFVSKEPFYFRGCYRESDCRKVNHPGLSSASCCHTDLCNWYKLKWRKKVYLNLKYPSV